MEKGKKTVGRRLKEDMAHNWTAYLMILPALALLILFAYVPMYGIIMAFEDFSPVQGFFGSPMVGWDNFARFFRGVYAKEVFFNTLTISLSALIFAFPCPIIFALLLNSVPGRRFKKALQMLSYAPYFISVIVIVGMLKAFLAPNTGVINHIAKLFGGSGTSDLMNDPHAFVVLYILSDIWQGMGWSSIIYISTLASVDPALYDAAEIDGAGKLQKIRFIDLPSLAPTLVVLLILQSGSILGVGFEKVYLMQSSANLAASEIISTYVYKRGLLAADYGMGTAVGLFNSMISVILLVIVNLVARKVSDYSLW